MASFEDYLKQIEKTQEKNIAEDIAVSDQTFDAQKKIVEEQYGADIADKESSYEKAFKQNEVQVKLNERYLERKAAEMGLTDSGMNRTQMTANQLSYANQKGELTLQKQKAIETLALAMRTRISEIDTNKVAAAQSIKSQYKTNAENQAASMYKATTAANEANADRINAAASSLNTLIGKLNEKDATDSSKWAYIQNYVNQHGVSNELLSALSSYGYDKDGAFGNVARFFTNKNFSDAAKVGRFVGFYKLYGMPSEEALNVLINNAPGHGVSYDELTKAIEEIG